ncbi:HEAT repeat domain-containing protein [Candidatus Micrarchaeota archaeon]|nr:HEAT repeat domain-containing protein [Candidatus Micrarchaeota archaeon]
MKRKSKAKIDNKKKEITSKPLVDDTTKKIEKLIGDLGNDDFGVRRDAFRDLKKIDDSKAVCALIKALGDENWKIRKGAVLALEKIDYSKVGPKEIEKVIDALIRALDNEFWLVKKSVGWALIKIDSIPALIGALKDKNLKVREKAAEKLGGIGSPAIPALINALKDEDRKLRENAAAVLAKILEKMTFEELIEFTQSDVFLKLADNPSVYNSIFGKIVNLI